MNREIIIIIIIIVIIIIIIMETLYKCALTKAQHKALTETGNKQKERI